MVLSWEQPASGDAPGEIRTMIVRSSPDRRGEASDHPSVDPLANFGGPAASGADPLGLQRPLSSPAAPPSSHAKRAQPAPPSLPPEQASTAGTASRDELLRAFLAGAGVPDLNMPGPLTPQLMQSFGLLLREATQGTLDLLLARSLMRREMHAEVTIIAASENNPLKFSPTVEVALAHLLAPQGRGFMAPHRALRNANDDLRAHELGIMAGMRAALAGVLTRFDPTQLEQRLTRKSMLPINRRAQLWDLFAELYGEISREAQDDFMTLFGREFLRAYEAQIARLGQEEKGGKR
jgi:FHA domain-containing protein